MPGVSYGCYRCVCVRVRKHLGFVCIVLFHQSCVCVYALTLPAGQRIALRLLPWGYYCTHSSAIQRSADFLPHTACLDATYPPSAPPSVPPTAVALLWPSDALPDKRHPFSRSDEGISPAFPGGFPRGCPELHLCCRRHRQGVQAQEAIHMQTPVQTSTHFVAVSLCAAGDQHEPVFPPTLALEVYYSRVVQALDTLGVTHAAVIVLKEAVRRSDPSHPATSVLWSLLFKHQTQLGHFTSAYSTMLAIPDRRRWGGYVRLLVCMCVLVLFSKHFPL